jgi:hypothetical protein
VPWPPALPRARQLRMHHTLATGRFAVSRLLMCPALATGS